MYIAGVAFNSTALSVEVGLIPGCNLVSNGEEHPNCAPVQRSHDLQGPAVHAVPAVPGHGVGAGDPLNIHAGKCRDHHGHNKHHFYNSGYDQVFN